MFRAQESEGDCQSIRHTLVERQQAVLSPTSCILTSSILTSCILSGSHRLGCSSLAECLSSAKRVMDLIPSTT